MSIQSIAVVGAGAMGKGIAEVAAASGITTTLVKATPGLLDEPRRAVAASLDRAVKRGKLDPVRRDETLGRIAFTHDLEAVASADLVIESVVEELPIKQQLFVELERLAMADAVLATNTSSLRVAQIGERLERSGRLLGLHFFSPVPVMKLVEIALTRETAPFAVERTHKFVQAIGKTPVLVGDSSGYIVNRLLVPYLLDGIAALEARVASAADIDTAMKLGCGHPMGPLGLADAIGIDIVYAMARTLYREFNDPRYSPPALLRRLVLAGHLGKKSGLGVYDYSADPALENPALHAFPVEESEEDFRS